jgi:stress-induced-phosphoprotein 1
VASGSASEEEMAERRARASADPEVQQILMDPVIKQVLQDMSEDPRAVAKHMAHPDIARKISRLAAAGIVQMR